MKYFFHFFTVILFVQISSCHGAKDLADETTEMAIRAAGLEKLDGAVVRFSFRDKQYSYSNSNGLFEYQRIQLDSLGRVIIDKLTNEGLIRSINGKPTDLSDKQKKAYANSVNSVIYFAFLPYRLNDPAVIKKYLGKVRIKNRHYHKIEISFRKEGGGKDFEDVFIYWFDSETYRLDYLAYSYLTDGGGIRFRESKNFRTVGKIELRDYNNYKPIEDNIALADLDSAFEENRLELLSEINLENIEVELIENK